MSNNFCFSLIKMISELVRRQTDYCLLDILYQISSISGKITKDRYYSHVKEIILDDSRKFRSCRLSDVLINRSKF